MLKFYKFSTRTSSGVVCASGTVESSTIAEFVAVFLGRDLVLEFCLENDHNNGSVFHHTCRMKAQRIEDGLAMITYKDADGEHTTGAQLSAYVKVRKVAKPMPMRPRRKRDDYQRYYGQIKPLAYVDWFGRKPEKNY